MRLAFAAAVCCGLVAPSLAHAQAFQAACKVHILCPGVQPGGGRLIACLREHKAQLSVPCRLAIADFFLNKQGHAAGGEGGSQRGPAAEPGEPRGAPDGPGEANGPGGQGPGGPGPGGQGPERGGPDGQGAPGPDAPGADGPDQGPPPPR